MGFMPGDGNALSITAALCLPAGGAGDTGTEQIEIPGKNKIVRAKFPTEPSKGLSIGWYSFIRASQLRKLRVPKPRVKPGEAVK